MKIINYFYLFLLLFMDSLYFLILFKGLTVLFLLIFTFIYRTFSKINEFQTNTSLAKLFLPIYFTIQLIFDTIHWYYYTISVNFYLYLYLYL